VDEDKLMEVAIEAGAEDVDKQMDGTLIVESTPEAFSAIVDAIKAAGLTPENAEITMLPSVSATLEGIEQAQQFMKMVEMLEDLDDVQEVYSNADIPNEIGDQL